MDKGIKWPDARSIRQRLETRLGPLSEFLRGVVLGRDRAPEELALAVVEACVGASRFKLVSGSQGPGARKQLARFLKGVPSAVKRLEGLHSFLIDNSDSLERIAARLEADVTWDYGAAVFPAQLRGLELLDLLERIAAAIESEAHDARKWDAGGVSISPPEEVRQHGCFDYVDLIPPEGGRSVQAMLAFQLEAIFRSASSGELTTVGEMPTEGQPHRPRVAKLVVATLEKRPGEVDGEVSAGDTGDTFGYQVEGSNTEITEYWVHSTVKDILQQYPHIKLVPWR